MMTTRYVPPQRRCGMGLEVPDPELIQRLAVSSRRGMLFRNFDPPSHRRRIRCESYPPIKVPAAIDPPVLRRSSPDLSDRSIIAGPLQPQKTNSLLQALGMKTPIISDENIASLVCRPLNHQLKFKPDLSENDFLRWIQIYLPILIDLYDQFITIKYGINFGTYAALTYQFIQTSAPVSA